MVPAGVVVLVAIGSFIAGGVTTVWLIFREPGPD